MSKYTTATPKKQAAKSNKQQQTATQAGRQARQAGKYLVQRSRDGRERPLVAVKDGLYRDPKAGWDVPALDDPKYPRWREKKRKTLDVATLYRATDDHQHADRVLSCATWLQYWADLAGDKRTLQAFNPCHLRMCPLCANRRARQMTARLIRILTAVKVEHPTASLLFLTLTVKNVPGDELRDTLTLLTKAWAKLAKRRPFMRGVKGWFRAIEITYNPVTSEYHPHIHAILVVEPAYFRKASGLYIPHSRTDKVPDSYKGPFWVDMWGECLGVAYKPSVRISRAKGKGGEQRDTDAASLAAALEAAKYATKDSDYLTDKIPMVERAGVLATYTAALRGKRLVALGGWLADAADGVDLEDDGDLVHGDEPSGDELTVATAEMLESYGWHFGVGEHVLKERRRNPDYQGPGGQGGGTA